MHTLHVYRARHRTDVQNAILGWAGGLSDRHAILLHFVLGSNLTFDNDNTFCDT